ncbi:MAG TPA: DNA primase [Solirubrobacterales bacterium]|jgi:DNA primase|nr:DNA primase [Solirubrobacterales bacterium]
MARFTDDSKGRVKEAADIVEIVSAYTDLQQRGQDYWGNCPFHDERTPSFKVNPRDKLYYCFGCEASGDVFRFVEEKEGLAFPEAVESLAERYGVEIERENEDPQAEEKRRRKARLWELLERTAKYYERYLWEAPKAEKARAYLAGRGLSEDVLRRFGVGMAPSAWDQVLTGSQRAGFKIDELQAAGLIQKGRQGGHYDRFRKRITFPIRDQRGRVLGFGARALSADSKPKYLNSPEGELYRKSHTLYGIDRARGPIAKARRAIVVEGYTDVLALQQAGVEEAVAIMGTAITPEQLSMLAGLTESVVLALDADQAGADAMIRAQKVAAGRGLELRVAAMPEGEDPADMLQEGSVDRIMKLVDEAIDLPSFRVNVALGRGELGSLAGRERVLEEVGPVLKAMGETALGFDELVRKVADRLDTDASLVLARVRSAPDAPTAPAAGANGAKAAPRPVAISLTPRETRERALLAMCVSDPKTGRQFIDRLTDEHLSPSGKPALSWLREHLDDPMAGLPRDDALLTSLITELVMRAESEPASEGAMQLNFDLLEQQRLEDGISAAQKAGDYEVSTRLSGERAKLTDRIAHAGVVG